MPDLHAETLWELIEARAAATPGGLLAVDEHDRTITFGGYRDACERAAAGFAAMGVHEGMPVSWQLPTWIESIVVVGALARLGAVQNPVLPICREREVGFITRQTGAQRLILPGTWRDFDFVAMAGRAGIPFDPRAAGTEVPEIPEPEILVVERDLARDPGAFLPAVGAVPPFVAPATGTVRWIFYTSGTTAEPKGVRHTDATVAASAIGVAGAYDLAADDRFALVFPLTHVGGIASLFSFLQTGAGAILDEAFDPARTIDVLRRHGVTLGAAGTAFWLAYLAAQRRQPGDPIFPRVRALVGGGAPKPPTLHAEVKAEIGGIGVASGYGLTECPSLALGTVRDPDDKLAVTEGRAVPGVEIRIVGSDGELLAAGREGEIRVRGPMLFRGYVDPSLDADALDADGFFRTGDLGSLDADGYLVITGRLKDVIIRKGENISAKEVEDVVYAHPGVTDVAVIGLPDAARGERCCAIVTLAPGAGLTLEELGGWCREHGLTTQKIPEQLEVLDELPRNPSGKVLKHELRDRYGDR